MPRIALYPGSFDPVTNGHLDVVQTRRQPVRPPDRRHRRPSRQKAAVFDRGAPGDGPGGIRPDRRRRPAAPSTATTYDNLTVTAAQKAGATIMIRGLRDGTDLDYEMQIAGMNETMAPEVHTVFLPASVAVRPITATLVRQIAAMGGDVSAFVPPSVAASLKTKFAS